MFVSGNIQTVSENEAEIIKTEINEILENSASVIKSLNSFWAAFVGDFPDVSALEHVLSKAAARGVVLDGNASADSYYPERMKVGDTISEYSFDKDSSKWYVSTSVVLLERYLPRMLEE